MATLPSNFSKRYINSWRSPKPARLFLIISSIILSQNRQSYCQVLFCILPFFPSSTSTFPPNQSIITPEEKNSCNVRTYNGWKSSLLFSTECKLKRSPEILANAFFLLWKILHGGMMQQCVGMNGMPQSIDVAIDIIIFLLQQKYKNKFSRIILDFSNQHIWKPW